MKVYFSEMPQEVEVKIIGNESIVFFRENIEKEGEQYIADEYTLKTNSTVNLLERIQSNKQLWLQAAIDEENKQIKNQIRERRERECFAIVNRGELWYETLTEEQKAELDAWYQAWLDAPETLVIPEKPEWV